MRQQYFPSKGGHGAQISGWDILSFSPRAVANRESRIGGDTEVKCESAFGAAY